MALTNVWHLRKVADASSKPCDICYKSTTSVLVTPDNKDYFYICPGHVKDRGFATPIIDEADIAAKKKREELEREVELVKKEYEERMKRKQESREAKKQEAGKDKAGKEKVKGEDEETDAMAEKEKDEKIRAVTSKQTTLAADDGPRIFALQKIFFQKRLDRIRNTEIAKRNREWLKSPNLFPSVPHSSVG